MAAKLLVLAGAALRASCFRLPNKSAPIYIDKTTGEYLPEVDGVYDNPNYLEDYILWAQAQEEANAAKGTDASATDTWGSTGVGAAGYDGSGGRSGAAETAIGNAGFGGAGGGGIGPAIGAGAGGAGAGAAGAEIENQPIPGGAGDISAGSEESDSSEGTSARVGEGQSVSDEGAAPVGGDAGASAAAGENGAVGAGNASASGTSVAELEKVVPDYIQDANNYLEYFNHYAEPKYNEDGENGTANLTKAPSPAMWRKVVVPQRELVEEKKEVKEVKELKAVKEVIEVNAAREEMKAAQDEKKMVKEVKKEVKEMKEPPAVRDFHTSLKQFLGVKQGAATLHKHHKKAHAAPAPAHHVSPSASTAAPVNLLLRKDDVKATEELQKKMETKSVPSSDLEKMLYMRNAPEWYNNLMVNTLKEDGEQPEGHLNMEAPLTGEELAAGGLGVAPQPKGANPAVLVGELTPEELAERVLAETP